ncbi:MAG: hypothetical protein ABL898_15340 [Hyphomicrobiaceae bacterium]
MWQLRISHLIVASAVSIVVAALCVVGVGLIGDRPVSAAAIGFFEAGVFALCSILSTLVAVAGVLLATDFRNDIVQTRAWQSAYRTPSLIAELSADEITATPWPPAYETEPQSADLRAIFQTYRFALPVVVPGDVVAATQVAPIVGNSSEPASPICAYVDSAVCASLSHDRRVRATKAVDAAGRQARFTMVASMPNLNAETTRIQHLYRTQRSMSKLRRVANGGYCSNSFVQVLVVPPSLALSVRSADVIVLAERHDRNNPQHNSDQFGNVTAQTQPACRGPPSHATVNQPSTKHGAFDKQVRPEGDVSTEPDTLVVVDNLGEPAQIGAAELSVIETYLDDVLCGVLAPIETGHDA